MGGLVEVCATRRNAAIGIVALAAAIALIGLGTPWPGRVVVSAAAIVWVSLPVGTWLNWRASRTRSNQVAWWLSAAGIAVFIVDMVPVLVNPFGGVDGISAYALMIAGALLGAGALASEPRGSGGMRLRHSRTVVDAGTLGRGLGLFALVYIVVDAVLLGAARSSGTLAGVLFFAELALGVAGICYGVYLMFHEATKTRGAVIAVAVFGGFFAARITAYYYVLSAINGPG